MGEGRDRSASPIRLTPANIHLASSHIRSIFGATPILPLEELDRDGIRIHLLGKFENAEALYTFKARGAEWMVYNLIREYRRHPKKITGDGSLPILVTASAGNHAQGVALAANRYGLESLIFMPENTPDVKVNRVEELGASIQFVGGFFDESLAAAKEYAVGEKKRIFIPPYEHGRIMEGQGSIAVEILSTLCPWHPDYLEVRKFQWQWPDAIVAGVGGGGLISGVGAIVEEFNLKTGAKTQVIGVQTEAANSMYNSLNQGMLMSSTYPNMKTIAEGIGVKQASERMFRTVQQYIDTIAQVKESEIATAMAYLAEHPIYRNELWASWERLNQNVPERDFPKHDKTADGRKRPLNIAEGAGVAGYAAVLFGDIDWKDMVNGRDELTVVCVITGSNIPFDKHAELTRGIVRPDKL